MNMVKHKRGSVSALSVQHEAELKAPANKPDDDIDYSDVPVTGDEQWSEAHCGEFSRLLRTQVSVRTDADVMGWLERLGEGYQARPNAILREAMLRKQNKKQPCTEAISIRWRPCLIQPTGKRYFQARQTQRYRATQQGITPPIPQMPP